jgi:translocation and assembly module TamB
MTPHPRARRALRLSAKILAIFVAGLLGLVALVLLSINLPPVSQWVAARVNAALEPTFKGRLVLHRLGHLDFGGITGAEVEVFDPAGTSVIEAHDVDVRLFWPGLAWQAVVTRPELLRVTIDRVALKDLEVRLIDDGNGSPTLALAFEPKEPTPEEETSSGATAIELEELVVETLSVRGALAGIDPIEADLSELRASLENDPAGTHAVLHNLSLTARQLPQVGTVTGILTANVTLPAAPEDTAKARASGVPVAQDTPGPSTAVLSLSPKPVQKIVAAFDGDIAGSGAEADVELTGEELNASFGMARLEPATITRLVPALAPRAPLSLSAKVNGLLSDLGFELSLDEPGVGNGAEISARGRVARQGESSKITATLKTSDVDLSRLLPEGAKTSIDLGADTSLVFDERGGEGNYRLVAAGSRYAGLELPRTVVEGKLKLPNGAPQSTEGQIEIDEPGAPTRIDYDVKSGTEGAIASLSSMTRLNRPERVKTLSGGLVLTGEVASRASYDQVKDLVDAEVRVNVQDMRHPDVRANRLDVAAMARGAASAPDLELLLNLTGVTAGNRKFSRVRVHALGTSDELKVGAQAYGNSPDEINVKAVLAPSSEDLVRSPIIRVIDEAGNLVIRAAGVTRTPTRLRIDGLSIEGPGRATASVSFGTELERLSLDTNQLDAARLLRIVGVKSPISSAKLDVQAEYVGGRTPHGKLLADVSDIGLGRLRGGAAKADMELRAGKLSGTANVELARGAKTAIAIDGVRLSLGGGPPPSLETMTGDVSLSGDIDLARLQPFLPFAGIERAAGQLDFDLSLKRQPGSTAPAALRAKVKTKKLVLVSERPDAEQMPSAEGAEVTAPWTLRGVDIDLTAALENQAANLKARLFDRRGDLVSVDADVKELGDLSNLRKAFERAPLRASVSMPRRDFERWPPPFRPAEVQGALTLQVDAEGTMTEPRVRARGRIDGFRAATDDPKQRRVDLELGALYQTSGGDVMLTAHEAGKVVLGIESRWTGDAARVGEALSAANGKSPLLGELSIRLEDFPVELIPALQHSHVSGSLTGTGKLDGLGRDARLSLDIGSRKLSVDRLVLNELRAKVDSAGGRLALETRIAGGGGHATVNVKTGLDWGDRLVPVPDQQLEGSLTAQSFPLATLQPLVEGSISELEGKLDANIRAELQAGQPRLSGNATLKDGVLHLPTVGQRFSEIGAKVTISPESLKVENVKARGLSGGFEAHAEAVLRGLTPVSANATLKIDEDDKLPLTIEGESLGDAWGSIETTYQVDEANKQNNIAVNLQKFHIQLPGAPPSGIQDLGQSEHVRVGYWRQDREFVTIPLQPLEKPSGPPSEFTTVVNVDLGEMWVEQGDQVEVGVGGKIQAKLGDELDVTGKIETRRGTLDISGKSFDIERGSVAFTGGPPDNPIISAVARYDSPAGYTVYAEYTGSATQGKLGLRSEPPLSQDEILTLLMFGTPDGSFGAGSGDNDSLTTAVSVAGGTAAQGLNRALSKVTDLDVSARVDTSTGAPRPELVLQLTPRVAARVTQALGEPAPGQSPDRTFVTIELRIASAWALSTMVGDRGATAFDVIWRRRY